MMKAFKLNLTIVNLLIKCKVGTIFQCKHKNKFVFECYKTHTHIKLNEL